MDAPPVQYVTTSDGMSIAYAVSGQGTPLVFLPGAFSHVRLAWEYPGLTAWLQGLAERFQVIQLDPRGFGMSARDVGETLARQDYLKDVEAVIERLKPRRLLLCGVSNGVNEAVEYALRYPERVIALILGTANLRWATAIFDLLPSQDWEAFLHSLVPRDRSLEERNRLVELRRQAEDQQNYVLRSRVLHGRPDLYAAEMEASLSKLQAATLVLRVRDYALSSMEQAARIAQLSGGRLVLIDGTDVYGHAAQGLKAIENFLAEVSLDGIPAPLRKDGLSQREIEVLRLVAAGRSNAQIADELVISQNTVIRHVSNIFAKTGAANRAAAGDYAHRHGSV